MPNWNTAWLTTNCNIGSAKKHTRQNCAEFPTFFSCGKMSFWYKHHDQSLCCQWQHCLILWPRFPHIFKSFSILFRHDFNVKLKNSNTVATSPVVLHWLCDLPQTRCARRTKIYVCGANSNNRVISSGDLYCCLLPWCEALRTSRSGFPIVTIPLVFFIF